MTICFLFSRRICLLFITLPTVIPTAPQELRGNDSTHRDGGEAMGTLNPKHQGTMLHASMRKMRLGKLETGRSPTPLPPPSLAINPSPHHPIPSLPPPRHPSLAGRGGGGTGRLGEEAGGEVRRGRGGWRVEARERGARRGEAGRCETKRRLRRKVYVAFLFEATTSVGLRLVAFAH